MTVCAFLLALSFVVEPGGTTFDEALAGIRKARADGDLGTALIEVRGTNLLSRTAVLTEADHDIAVVGTSGAAFSGGTPVVWRDSGRGWWEADLPKAASGRPVFIDQLWVNGRRAPCARLPNEGYYRIVRPENVARTNGTAVTYVEHVTMTNGDCRTALAALSAAEMRDAVLCVIHKWSFARRVLRAYDPETGRVETTAPAPWNGWQKWSERESLVWFENVRGGFDAPGEWFCDRINGKVLYRPRPGEGLSTVRAWAPFAKLSRLLDIRGDFARGRSVRNVSFRGVAFLHSDSPRAGEEALRSEHPDAVARTEPDGPQESWQHQAASGSDGMVTVAGAEGLRFESCTFRHSGNYALRFDSGCRSNAVVSCRLDDVGAGGIRMGSRLDCRGRGSAPRRAIVLPDRPDSTAFNLISNCTLTCGGRYNPEGTAIAIMHCSDTRVIHNDIRDFFYTGISVGWTWGFAGSVAQRNEIAFNRIVDLGHGVMSDMSGIYMLGTSFGTHVHENVVKDICSYSYGGFALYCDEGSEGILMERNLCVNSTDGAFYQHYGSGCVIRDNILLFNRIGGAVRMYRQVVDGIPCTLHFIRNIVVVRSGPLCRKGVAGVGGVWANNVWYDLRGERAADFGGLDWAAWQASGKETGSVFADPAFVDLEGGDYRLTDRSPARRFGFREFDFSRAGAHAE